MDAIGKRTLLIDCSFIEPSWTASTALAIYAVRLIQGFLEYGSAPVCVLVWKDNEELMDRLVGRKYDKIALDRKELITRWRPFYRLTGILPPTLKRGISERSISTVLLPYSHGVVFYYPRRIRHFAVVHDMFLLDRLRAKQWKTLFPLVQAYLLFLLRKFSGLISISEGTHVDLLQRGNLESAIAYNSIPFDFSGPEQSVPEISGRKYILDINRYERYKNAETLIRAFYQLKDTIPHILYLKGDKNNVEDRSVLEKLVAELGLEDRVVFDMEIRTEGEMRYLYSHADLFVSPSMKEGFGWTPIEAAISRTPVLVSDIEIFKEITCDKIPRFNPHSPEDLAAHILETLNNPPSEQEKTELADFYLDKYSLKNQINRLEEIMDL